LQLVSVAVALLASWLWVRASQQPPPASQAGGWRNTATLATIYQEPDEATLYAVVSQPAELRER
jgi:hypothetical protein